MSSDGGELTRRDPRLVAALRHAPDRHAEPPPVLDQRILDQARRGARTATPRGAWQALQDLLQALTRPAAGAALASVVLATTVVLLWRDGPPRPGTDRTVSSEAPAPAAAALPAAPEPRAATAPAVAVRQGAPAQKGKREAASDTQRARRWGELQPAAKSAAAAPVSAEPPTTASAAPPAPPAPLAAEGKAAADALNRSGTTLGAAAQRGQVRALRSTAAPDEEGTPPEGLTLAMRAPNHVARALQELASRPELRAAWERGWRAAERSAPAINDSSLRDTSFLPLHDTSGALLGHLRLEADTIVWLPVTGAAARLALDAAALSTLRGVAATEAANPPPPR